MTVKSLLHKTCFYQDNMLLL